MKTAQQHNNTTHDMGATELLSVGQQPQVIQITEQLPSMYDEMSAGMPNVVHCRTCGREQSVDPAACLRYGWPKCCGATMRLGLASA